MVRNTWATKVLAPLMAVLALGVLSGCGGDDDAPPSTSTGGDSESSNETTEDATAGGVDGRAFDSTDEAIEKALMVALSADRIEFDGNRVIAHMPEGSASDPTAGLNCLTFDVLLSDEELGFFGYSDGLYDCRDQP